MTHPKVFADVVDSLADVLAAGGVPVREVLPESSPPRIFAPGPPNGGLRPLLLLELNNDVGPNDMGCWFDARDVAPLPNFRRSSIPTVFRW